MWHKSQPLFVDSVGVNRAMTKKNNPLFVYGKGTTKKPSDMNDVSNSKITYERKEPGEMSESVKNSILKGAKTIKSKGGIDENKWMWTIFLGRMKNV